MSAVETQLTVIVDTTMYKSLLGWLLYYCEELFISVEQGAFIIRGIVVPLQSSPFFMTCIISPAHT